MTNRIAPLFSPSLPHQARLAALGAAAFSLSILGVFGATAQANEPWRYERAAAGGYAQSCDRQRDQRICATVTCGRGVNGYEIGLTSWSPRRRVALRDGVIGVDDRGRDAVFRLRESRIVGRMWIADLPRGGRRLVERMKDGNRLAIQIAARGPAFVFSLRGSNNALSRLERRCERVAARNAARDDRVSRNDRLFPEFYYDDSRALGEGDLKEILRRKRDPRAERMSPRDVRRLLRIEGFTKVQNPKLLGNGNIYIVDAKTPNGREVRLVVDSETGEIARLRQD